MSNFDYETEWMQTEDRITEMRFMSCRPACPCCKNSSLTNELYAKSYDILVTACAICKARVFMTKAWKIKRAEKHYWPNGEII